MQKTGGIIVFNPSNPGAYMSAYEIFKSAQVELCNTLAEEIAETPVITYAITPGFVKTDTAVKAVEIVASSMEITFYDHYAGWQKKNLFQKKFILGDFKKQMGLPAEVYKQQLETLQDKIKNHQWSSFADNKGMFIKLQHFYEHQRELLQGYEKNAARLANDTRLLNSWLIFYKT